MATAAKQVKEQADETAEQVELDRLFGVDEEEREWLVPLRKIPADDMPVVIGDEEYFLQEGRTVWIIPVTSFGTMFSTAGLLLGGSTENAAQLVSSMSKLCVRVSEVVAKWDIVGFDGEPLDQPYRNPDVIESLTEDQFAWLIQQITERETDEERGKGASRSRSTSTAARKRRQK